MKLAVALLVGSPSGAAEGMLADFDQAGYQVHVFGNVEDQAGILAAFPDIMHYIGSNAGGEPERLVLISNYRELLFSWFRCYNSLIDDFVFCCDEHDYEAPVNAATQMYKCLAAFNNSGRETLQGRIFIAVGPDNFATAAALLLRNNNFVHFAPYNEFNFAVKTAKTPVNKRYYLNKREYEYRATADGTAENILLSTDVDSAEEDREFPAALSRHPHFVFFYIAMLSMQAASSAPRKLLAIFSALNRDNAVAAEYYRHYFEQHGQDARLSFQAKIILAFFALQFGITDGVGRFLMQTMLSDSTHRKYHYFLLVQALSYEANLGMQPYAGLYNDRQQILSAASEYYRPALAPQTGAQNDNNSAGGKRKVAVLVPQLLALVHAPTRVILNYCKQLKLDYPDYELKIFVEDTHFFDPEEAAIMPFLFKSVPSGQDAGIHREFLSPAAVDIHYSAVDLPRKERLERDLAAITSFGPDLVWAVNADVSILREVLFSLYPVLDMPSTLKISCSCKADLFICFQDIAQVKAECEKYDFLLESINSGKFVRHQPGMDLAGPQREKSRSEYFLRPEDFVLITVGNRLDADLTADFVLMVDSFLDKHANAKWVVVGKGGENAVGKLCPGSAGNRVFIEYDDDLAALYAVCDVYINPFRQGGGVSAAMAMHQSLPVVTLGGSDVGAIAGSEGSLTDKDDYWAEMERLYADGDYRRNRGRRAKQRIDEVYGMAGAVKEMVGFFGQTLANYRKRQEA
ncbi:glycosyltransferase [Anaeroselena agilis]|uniref:Glycosyltransferase n=1 Tax=Anaeroselena agilis TaxID=3063788 RepID=A0ABU3NSF2_9FIRM|nr:glycosyltransferase [Selenomonadales bacterium 4137-cl]